MFITEDEFNQKYSNEFNKLYDKYKNYVDNPDNLKNEIENEKKERVTCRFGNLELPVPRPDKFTYQIIQYKGFVKYPDRLKNFIIAKNSKKEENRFFLPSILDIEPNAKCNFRCIMCQVSEWEHGKRTDDLKFEDFKKFIDTQYGLTEVKLQGMGEPLLHKDFFKMVKYLRDKDIWVRTTVNGSILEVNDNYKKLVDCGINEVQTSFDGATKEVFEKIRRRSNFERVVENLKLLNNYANSKDLLVTRMWVLLQENNKHQLKEFVELAEYMEFKRMTFSLGLGFWGQKDFKNNIEKLKVKQLVNDEEILKLMDYGKEKGIDVTFWNLADKYVKGEYDKICNWPFTRAYISADLKVVPCCMIGNPDVADFGDARNFNDVWFGDKFRAFRKAHLKGNIPGYCENCYE